MMQYTLLTTVHLLLSTTVVVSGQNSPCFGNLNDLSQAIYAKATFTVETYSLCPDTVFDVGFLNTDNGYDGGDAPIPLRANSKILCGEDGSSANNCVLRGGGFQAIATLNLFVGEDPLNVVLSGITFDSPLGNGALLVSPGEITFNDCIFRNAAGTAARLIYFSQNSGEDDERRLDGAPLRRLVEFLADPKAQEENIQRIQQEMERDRALQKATTNKLVVAFESCRFENNKYGGETGHSIIEIATPHVTASISNTIFHKNDYATGATAQSHMVFGAQPGAIIELDNNCFIHNEVAGKALLSFADDPVGPFQNNFGTKINGLRCQFISVASESCIEFDTNACPLPFEYEELSLSETGTSGADRFMSMARLVILVVMGATLLA